MDKNSSSPGKHLAGQLKEAWRSVGRAPRQGARPLPLITGLTKGCHFHEPVENVLAEVGDFLVDSGRVYVHGNAVVVEVRLDTAGPKLATLRNDTGVESAASGLLGNLLL